MKKLLVIRDLFIKEYTTMMKRLLFILLVLPSLSIATPPVLPDNPIKHGRYAAPQNQAKDSIQEIIDLNCKHLKDNNLYDFCRAVIIQAFNEKSIEMMRENDRY